MALLDILLQGVKRIWYGGSPMPQESGLAFQGAGVTVADSPTTGQTVVTIAGAAGTVVGTGSIGVSTYLGATIISAPTVDALLAVANGNTPGALTVTSQVVENQASAGNGPITVVRQFQTSGATPGSANISLPSGTGGPVDVIFSAINATDGGSQAWRGKVVDIAGTTTVTKAFAAVDTWDSTSGASAWTASVAESGSVVTATGTASSGSSTVQWVAVFQYVEATN